MKKYSWSDTVNTSKLEQSKYKHEINRALEMTDQVMAQFRSVHLLRQKSLHRLQKKMYQLQVELLNKHIDSGRMSEAELHRAHDTLHTLQKLITKPSIADYY